MNLKKIVEDLVESFLDAGDLALQLRKDGLIKKIKSDNTPVSNGEAFPARIPCVWNSNVPEIPHTQTIATKKRPIEVDNNIPK